MTTHSFAQLTDRELLASIHAAANHERAATARLIALLGELDTRRLYLGEGCSSLFTYCTQVLHLSEHAAYNRIETARAARRFPVIFELIEVGAITLTSVRLLAPHLTDANHRDLLEGARHKMKRDVELLIATIRPRADVPSVVRKLSTHAAKTLSEDRRQDPPKDDASSFLADAEPACTRPAEPVRIQPVANVKPLAQSGTRFRCRSAVRRTPTCDGHRIYSGTRFRMAIQLRSLRVRLNYC
jgi:hypothetical protein